MRWLSGDERPDCRRDYMVGQITMDNELVQTRIAAMAQRAIMMTSALTLTFPPHRHRCRSFLIFDLPTESGKPNFVNDPLEQAQQNLLTGSESVLLIIWYLLVFLIVTLSSAFAFDPNNPVGSGYVLSFDDEFKN